MMYEGKLALRKPQGATGTLKKYDKRLVAHKRMHRDNRIRNFYNELDLPEFKEALKTSKDPKFQMLMAAIMNPRLAKCSFTDLCKRCNLTINDISGVWRDHQLARGMMRMMGHMPDVMEDVAVDAKSRTYTCPSCGGTGKSLEVINKMDNAICKECRGDGKIRVIGDKDARNLLFESVGLKKGGFSPSVNVNVGTAPVPSLEDVISDAEKAMDFIATEAVEVTDGTDNSSREVEEDRGEAGKDREDADGGADSAAE